MGSDYPAALDTTGTFPTQATLATHGLNTDPHSKLHGDIGAAIRQMQSYMGTATTSDASSIVGRLNAIEGVTPTYYAPKLYNGGSGGYTEIGYGTASNVSGNPTLSSAISSTTTTSVSVSSAANLPNGDAFMVDSEVMRVVSGGGTSGTTTLTVVRGIAGTTKATHSSGANLKAPMIRYGKYWKYGRLVEFRAMIRLGSSPTLGAAGSLWAMDLPVAGFGSIGNTADIIGQATIGHLYFQHKIVNVHLGAPYDVTNYSRCYFVPPNEPVLTNTSNTYFEYNDPGYCEVATSDLFTCATAHGLSAGDRVRLSAASGTWPAGLALGEYYVISSGLTTTAFKVSATSGGSAVDVTSAGQAWVRKPPLTPIPGFLDFHVRGIYDTAA